MKNISPVSTRFFRAWKGPKNRSKKLPDYTPVITQSNACYDPIRFDNFSVKKTGHTASLKTHPKSPNRHHRNLRKTYVTIDVIILPSSAPFPHPSRPAFNFPLPENTEYSNRQLIAKSVMPVCRIGISCRKRN